MISKSDKLLMSLANDKNRWKMRLRTYWKHLIGDLYNFVRIEKISGTMITLIVKNSVWAQEIQMLSEEVINKINKFLKAERIKKIRITTFDFDEYEETNDITSQKCNGQLSVLSVKNPSYHATLTPVEKRRLKIIGCKKLKASLKSFYLKCKGRVDNENKDNFTNTGIS
ncbi:DUF721 domain-containing protein [Candidatus Dependentiae bacterium]